MSTRGGVSQILKQLRDRWAGAATGSRTVKADENGAALVEFTVLMPLFFLILFGIVEFGAMLFLQNNMTNAAREGARTSAVQGGSMAAANQAACRWLSGSGQTFTITSTDLCNAQQDVNVQISISKASASFMNTFFSLTSSGALTSSAWGGTLSSSVTMRKENSCTGTQAAVTCQCNTSGATPSGC
jgi:Flp pilus assembly protein TadG